MIHGTCQECHNEEVRLYKYTLTFSNIWMCYNCLIEEKEYARTLRIINSVCFYCDKNIGTSKDDNDEWICTICQEMIKQDVYGICNICNSFEILYKNGNNGQKCYKCVRKQKGISTEAAERSGAVATPGSTGETSEDNKNRQTEPGSSKIAKSLI